MADITPKLVFINTTDSMATVLGTGYLNTAQQVFGHIFSDNDMVLIKTSSGVGMMGVSISGGDISLVDTADPGTVIPPVVAGAFAIFNSSAGELKDSGYSPSDPAKTKVAMVSSAVATSRIATFSDTAGTINDDPVGGCTNAGNISAGLSGTAGALRSFPGTAAKGHLEISATANTGNTAVIITNEAHGQATTYTIPDVGAANGSILNCALADADASANLITFDVTITAAAIASGAYVKIIPGSGAGSTRYKFREIFLNSNGTNFSGGGGDRNIAVTDGTNVYTVIPAATAQSLVNARWGSTGVPFPASVALNTSSVAGQSIVVQYSGGAADYAAGSLVISGIAERVA
jgi:hypothetical protein